MHHVLVRSEECPNTYLYPVTKSPHGRWTLTYEDNSERTLILCEYAEVRKLMRRGSMVLMHRLNKPLEFPYNLYAIREADKSSKSSLRCIRNDAESYSFILKGRYGHERLVTIRNVDVNYHYKGRRGYEQTASVEDSKSTSIFRGRRGHERCVQIDIAERSDYFKGSPERLYKSVDRNSTTWFNGPSGHERVCKRQFHEGVVFKYTGHNAPIIKDTSTIQDSCVVCMDAPRCFAVVPCGHLCLCESCRSMDEWTKCPLCRESVQNLLHVYM